VLCNKLSSAPIAINRIVDVPITPVQSVCDLGIYLDADACQVNCFTVFCRFMSAASGPPTSTDYHTQDFNSHSGAFPTGLCQWHAGRNPSLFASWLQSVLNVAAQLTFCLKLTDHITDGDQWISLRWLRVPERIQYNIALLTSWKHSAIPGTTRLCGWFASSSCGTICQTDHSWQPGGLGGLRALSVEQTTQRHCLWAITFGFSASSKGLSIQEVLSWRCHLTT